MANEFGFLEQQQEALKYHREALKLRRKHLGDGHRDTLYSMWGVAAKMMLVGQGAEAIPLIDECLGRALETNGGPEFYRLADQRMDYFEKKKDAAGCRASAERWERFNYTDAASLYHAARFRAITAKILRATDADAAKAEADKAMEWLKASAAAGYKALGATRDNADFEALHDRADFQQLVTRD